MIPITIADSLRLRSTLYFAGLLVAQRFTLPTLSAYACMIPLLLLAVPAVRAHHALTVTFIALLASVDLGGEVYLETPSVLRYLIYAALAALVLKGKWRFGHRSITAAILYLGLLVINTMSHPYALDGYSFLRDLIVLSLGFAVCFQSRPERVQPLDYGLLNWFCMGVITSELLNILFFYQLSSGEYLAYSSYKFLVVIPCLYMLLSRNYLYSTLVGALTLIVLTNYASRMLMLSFLSIVLLILLRDSLKFIKFPMLISLAALAAVAYLIVDNSEFHLDAFRALTAIATIVDALDMDILRQMDPVRFIENSIFFGQAPYSLLFGNGLGSGIFDAHGEFAFVPDDGAAFSSKELSESHFFRLHDSWTWFGYRLGLLSYLMFVMIALKGSLSLQPRTAMAAAMMLLTMINSTFSVGGLFLCAAFALQYRREVSLERTTAVS